jgi:hypothetical protein
MWGYWFQYARPLGAAGRRHPVTMRGWKGPGADSEEKREPVSDIDIAVADSLKVLDLKWPIREATEVVRRCNMSRRAKSRLMQRSKQTPIRSRQLRTRITSFPTAFSGSALRAAARCRNASNNFCGKAVGRKAVSHQPALSPLRR